MSKMLDDDLMKGVKFIARRVTLLDPAQHVIDAFASYDPILDELDPELLDGSPNRAGRGEVLDHVFVSG